jgi:hypothetical protein
MHCAKSLVAMTRLTLLGVGAMRSPRYAPAGLLVEHGRQRVVFDGGPGATPKGRVDAWLVTDERAELIREIRALARRSDLAPVVAPFRAEGGAFHVRPLSVVHTSHPTYGYRIDVDGLRIAWAPEFFETPTWIEGFDLVFADGAGWARPIRFAHGTGGHACVLDVAQEAQTLAVHRLVFAHLGRPTIRALDAGERPPFGEIGHDDEVFTIRGSKITSSREAAQRSRLHRWA